MISLLPLMLLTVTLPPIILMLSSLFSLTSHSHTKDREMSAPFECGFSPISKARLPFSLRFFLLAVLFLIFDIEIVILLPVIIIISWSPLSMFASPTILFLLLLMLGLAHEMNEGSLKWAP